MGWTERPEWLHRRWWRPRNVWAALASIAYLGGGLIALFSANRKLDTGASEKVVEADLIVYVIVGLLLGGVGQLMCATVHGASSHRATRYDGWGKVVSIFGWSLGLFGATFLYMKDTGAPGWLLFVVVGTLVFPPVATVSWSFWRQIKSIFSR